MLNTRRLNRFLSSTTALIGVGLVTTTLVVTPIRFAQAADITSSTPGPITLSDGEVLNVTGTGEITGASRAVTVDSIAAADIDNAGNIEGSTHAIEIVKGGSIANTLNNSGTIYSSNGQGIYADDGSIRELSNQASGVITGSEGDAAIELTSRSSIGGTLSNAGIISGTNAAIKLDDSSIDTVVNEAGGQLTGLNFDDNMDGSGIYLTNGSHIDGSIENYGTITAEFGSGIYLDQSTANTITNHDGGVIEDGFAGIRLSGSSMVTDINNEANAVIGGNVAGIFVGFDSIITGTLHNSGDISTSSSAGVILDGGHINILSNDNDSVITGEDGNAAIELANEASIYGSLDNWGEISGSGSAIKLDNSIINILTNRVDGVIKGFSYSDDPTSGIYVRNGSQITGALHNYGKITSEHGTSITVEESVTGDIVNHDGGSIADGDVGIVSVNSTIASITNEENATISGDYAGIYLIDNTTVTGSLTNDGVIKGYYGLAILESSISGGVINTGTIEGTSGLAIGMEDMTSHQTITLNGGRVIGDIADNHISDGLSTVVIGDDFKTEGDITVSNLVINAGKKLTINADNTVTLHQMSDNSGANLVLVVAGDDSFSKVAVTGGGQGINLTGLNVSVSVTNEELTNRNEMQIGAGNDAVVGLDGGLGQEATKVEDTSVLWDFILADGAQNVVTGSISSHDLFLIVSKAMDIEDVVSTPNNKNMAKVLNELESSSNPELQQVWQALNNAESEEEIKEIVEALQPDIGGGTVSAATFTANTSFDITSNRLLSVRTGNFGSSGISSGDVTDGLQIWTQAFGELATQSNRDGIAGFDLSSFGLAAGVDSEKLVDDAVIGVALGYSSTSVDSEGSSSAQTDISSYQLTLYGDYDVSDQFFVNGMMAYAYHDNEGSRVPSMALVAKSKYAAHQYVARVEVGKDFPVGEFVLSPNGMAQLGHYNPDSYTETGAGGANLNVDQASTNSAELGVGMDVKWSYNIKSGGKLETSVGAQYRYDFIGDAVSTSTQFVGGGSAVESIGFDPAQSTVDLGAAVRYQMDDNWEVSAQYDFEYKADYRAHTASLRAAYSF